MTRLTIETRSHDDGRQVVLVLHGELDLVTHQVFRREITRVLESTPRDIIVDLTDTTFMDSTAIGALISARRRTYAHHASFALVCHDQRLRRLLQVTGLDKVFTIWPDDEAGRGPDGSGVSP
jgi:anti-sigma B factor antagonist